jgi:hypothetical protein
MKWTFLAFVFNTTLGLAQTPELILLQGQRKLFPRAHSIWIENGSVLRAEESSRGEEIRGVKPGQSELRLDGNSMMIQVLSLEQSRTKNDTPTSQRGQ